MKVIPKADLSYVYMMKKKMIHKFISNVDLGRATALFKRIQETAWYRDKCALEALEFMKRNTFHGKYFQQ